VFVVISVWTTSVFVMTVESGYSVKSGAFNQSINLFASDHMDPYHNKRKYKEMIE